MELPETSDEELYARWWAAAATPVERQASADEIDRRHRRRLSGFCYRILRSADSAEDAVNHAFLKLFEKQREFTRTLRAWLWATADNRCKFLLSARQQHKADPLPPELDDPRATDPHSDCVTNDEERALDACLSKLPAEHRRYVELRAFDGFTAEEAAEALGLSLSPAGHNVRYQSILSKLRECLEKTGIRG